MNRSREILIAELELAGAQIRGNKILCPYHPDTNPSGSIFSGEDGIFRYKCFSCGAGGDVFDLRALRTGKPLSEILRENAHDDPKSKSGTRPHQREGSKPASIYSDSEAVYEYLKKSFGGSLEAVHRYDESFSVIRWRGSDGKKQIRPVLSRDNGLVMEFPEGVRPLYRAGAVDTAKTVIVCEGELKCDILAGYGFPAATSSGGSKSVALTGWTPLAGKNVIVWPDSDEPGRAYAAEVIKILDGLPLAARVKTINPSELDLQDGEDAADYVKQLKNAGFDDLAIRSNLLDVFRGAKSIEGPGAEIKNLFIGIGQGKFTPIETGFRALDDLLQILPGTLNLICGDPGSAKSLCMLQLARQWFETGTLLSIFELEKNRPYHLRRALAQRAGQSLLTRNAWVMKNSETAVQIAAENIEFMDSFGRLIDAMPEKMVFQKDVIAWAEHKVKTGCRVLIVDPATKAERTDEPFKADARFVTELQRIATMSGAVIFLVLHPSKTLVPIPDLCYISGGAAYSRFADNALWLQMHEEGGRTSLVKTCCGTIEETHDLSMWILKSRDGAGTGSRIAFQFDRGDLTLREVGKICREKKQKKSFDN